MVRALNAPQQIRAIWRCGNKKNIKLCKMKNQKLFNHMRDEHDLILLESEMREIRNIVMEENTEQCQIANVSHRFLT